MGKDLRGKELGAGIHQQQNGTYCARFVNRYGERKSKRSKKLQDVRQWLAEETYIDEHSNLEYATEMMVDAWFDYWIKMKKTTVRPNTVRNYEERYRMNIQKVIGRKLLRDVKPIHCQKIMTDMANEGYKSTTIHQTRITLYNMLDYAKENDIIRSNPCKKSVKSDIGEPTEKKKALTIDVQRTFLEYASGYRYDNQFRFVLQTGLRIGELVGLTWDDIDFESRTLTVQRTMEYRYSVGEWRIGEPKTKSGFRTIPLTDEALRILSEQKVKNSKIVYIQDEWKNHIFLSRKGEPVKNTAYDSALFSICDKANIDRFSMHVLRHTFATRCIEAGMKPITLSRILGHSTLATTMNLYVHTTEDEKQKQIDLVADALNLVENN